MKKIILTILISSVLVLQPFTTDAGLLFHATKRALVRRILKRGFSPKRMSRQARFGKGVYLSRKKTTALKEKPGADAVIIFKEKRAMKVKKLNVNQLPKKEMKKITGDNDLRGNIHNQVIGPDLGKKIGRWTGRNGKIVIYKSAKDPEGTNVFIPLSVYKKNRGRLLKPIKVIENGR